MGEWHSGRFRLFFFFFCFWKNHEKIQKSKNPKILLLQISIVTSIELPTTPPAAPSEEGKAGRKVIRLLERATSKAARASAGEKRGGRDEEEEAVFLSREGGGGYPRLERKRKVRIAKKCLSLHSTRVKFFFSFLDTDRKKCFMGKIAVRSQLQSELG